ncbi:MarR family winged helix-turn-helix transcriptional regulator [Phytohalomonas tamaricis]|uniref:MarR family winged helix-turn-helix transcriptional regulator n=1 Tax=Phytohalomonas tamaricis TaxID=2081032 RepID=UPI000D0BBCE3|nr:MarR family transcriptional regulator [Phytohalomonas tamaricis]
MKNDEWFDQLSIGMRLAFLHRRWRAVVDASMHPLGLTQSRWAVLVHLDRLGEGATQSALAQDLGIELPSLMRTLENLEDAGLVVRQRCEHDRRARSIGFTPQGREMLASIRVRVKEAQHQLLADIPEDELAVFESVMRRIADNADIDNKE